MLRTGRYFLMLAAAGLSLAHVIMAIKSELVVLPL